MAENKSSYYLYGANIILILCIVGIMLHRGFSQQEQSPTVTQATKEVVLVAPNTTKKVVPISEAPIIYDYIEITHGCWPSLNETCIVAYNTPNALQGVPQKQLRKGTILKVKQTLFENGEDWYEVTFEDEWLRYPERQHGTWFVRAQDARLLSVEGKIEFDPALISSSTASSTIPNPNKVIIIDRSDQKLYAYEEDVLFTEEVISTGLNYTPTPRGTFRIFKKMPSRYMQGPLPGISEKYYDLPGVPWNMYFTEQGGAIHGAYWHDSFGMQWSSGCVNVPLDRMERLYKWADLGTTVIVRD